MEKETTPEVEETEKCWLEFSEEGALVCTHNHTLGALCLGDKCRYCHELKCVCYTDTPTKTDKQ